MTTLIKTAAAAILTTGLIVTAAAVPQTASAYTHYVCKYEQKHDEHTGTIVGAVAGGVIGSKMGHDHGKSVCESRVAYRERVEYRNHGRDKVVYRYVRQ